MIIVHNYKYPISFQFSYWYQYFGLIAQVIAEVHIVYLGFMNISMEVLQSKCLIQFGFLDICSISKICPPEEHGELFNN